MQLSLDRRDRSLVNGHGADPSPPGVLDGATHLRGSQSGFRRAAAQTGTEGDDGTLNVIQLLDKAGQIVDELARLGTTRRLPNSPRPPPSHAHRVSVVAALQQIEALRPQRGDGRFELGTAVLRWSDAAVESFVNRDELGQAVALGA